MSVNRFIAENSPLAERGWLPTKSNAGSRTRWCSMPIASSGMRPPWFPAEPMREAGYGMQYVWERAGEGVDAATRQDMIGPASTLALGCGGMGHIHGGSYFTVAGAPRGLHCRARRWPPRRCSRRRVRALRDGLPRRRPRGLRRPARVRASGARSASISSAPSAPTSASCTAAAWLDDGDRWWKEPSMAFQMPHLLAFLALDGRSFAPRASGSPATDGHAPCAAPVRRHPAELPPSVLWCQMTMRAERARRTAART